MKRQILFMAALCLALSGQAQTDTTAASSAPSPRTDTIRIGRIIIVKDGNRNDGNGDRGDSTFIHEHHKEHRHYKPSNVSTNWIILDLGFSNFTDKTNYASASTQQFAPGATRDWFNLRTGKSINVNIWLFMQKLNLIKHVLNLKYGLGIELNNYRYTEDIRFVKDPTGVIMDSIHYSKNKLAADYYTVPMMLDFNFTPHRKEGFGFSVGASAGYKYSSREKLISRQTGKYKIHDNFDMEPWKISWIGELHLGPVKLYGSLATKSMFRQGLDQTPYTVGIRLSNW